MDYRALGLKVGLEIHQQLATHKLFCEDRGHTLGGMEVAIDVRR